MVRIWDMIPIEPLTRPEGVQEVMALRFLSRAWDLRAPRLLARSPCGNESKAMQKNMQNLSYYGIYWGNQHPVIAILRICEGCKIGS